MSQSNMLRGVVMTAMLGMVLALSVRPTGAAELDGGCGDEQDWCTPADPRDDGPDPDAMDETLTCEVLFESEVAEASMEREVEFRCLMDDTEWARYQENPGAYPERCMLLTSSAAPMFLAAAQELPLTLEIIYMSDTEVQVVRPDGTKVTIKVPKGEIVNKVVQKNSPTLDRELGQEVRALKDSAKAAGKKYRWLLKGGFKFGLPGLISLAAATGPAFAEAALPETCAALKDPDRGDSCKEIINWVAKAQKALFEKSCEACYNASLDKLPTKAAELCRAAENPATYDSALQKVMSDLAEKCGGRAGGYLTQKNNGPLPISGVTPPTLKEVCPYR